MSAGFLIESDLETPVVLAAVHDGHELRAEVAALIALDDAARLREEDPFTERWTRFAGTRLIGRRSRFEVDLNRPREGAVYREPADAWGLEVWGAPLPDDVVNRSLELYDAFYAEAERTLSAARDRWGSFVVLDLHTYNHRRDGADGAPAPAVGNPEVNIGTGTMDRDRWAPVIDRVLADLRAAPYHGRTLDVRENVKFRGGAFSAWVHRTFPDSGCSIAIEFKKFFMDEWTGVPDDAQVAAIGEVVQSILPGVLDTLPRVR